MTACERASADLWRIVHCHALVRGDGDEAIRVCGGGGGGGGCAEEAAHYVNTSGTSYSRNPVGCAVYLRGCSPARL